MLFYLSHCYWRLCPKSFGEYSYLLSIFMLVLLPATAGVSRFNMLKCEYDDLHTPRLHMRAKTYGGSASSVTSTTFASCGLSVSLRSRLSVAVCGETRFARSTRTTIGNVTLCLASGAIDYCVRRTSRVWYNNHCSGHIIVFTASFLVAYYFTAIYFDNSSDKGRRLPDCRGGIYIAYYYRFIEVIFS